jgi:Flp pilus assembly protein TadD
MRLSRCGISVGPLLGLVVLAIFGRTVYQRFDFVNFDDDLYITLNPQVQAGLTPRSIVWAFTTTYCVNWHPLTWLSFQLDHDLYGLGRPWGYHLTNVLLHALNTVLLFGALRRMTGALGRSAMVAALFGLHPLHVESVAWVSERKDVLSALFWMLSLRAYAAYTERPGRFRYLVVAAAFVLGLMAKSMVVTLPGVLLLLDYWPLRRVGREGSVWVRWRWLLLEKVPLLALAAVSSLMTLHAQNPTGAVSALPQLPVRVAKALVFYGSYLTQTLWPTELAAFYPDPGGNVAIGSVLGVAVVLAAVTLLVIRGARAYPYLLVGWLWYLGTLLPVIGLFRIRGGQGLADRYTYIPLIGLFLMAVWFIHDVALRLRWPRWVLGVAAAVVLSACAVVTWRQVGTWRDSRTLWEHALQVTRDNYMAHDGLGTVFKAEGRWADADDQFARAIQLNSEDVEALFNRAAVLEHLERPKEAIVHYQAGLDLYPDAKAHLALAIILEKTDRFEQAIPHYQSALRLKTDLAQYLDERVNEALTLRRQGKIDDAIRGYERVLRIAPDHAGAHANQGAAYAIQGKLDQAIAHFAEAVRLDPDDQQSRRNLALALRQREQRRDAPRP